MDSKSKPLLCTHQNLDRACSLNGWGLVIAVEYQKFNI